jgi:NAD(P)-dependent dehydrogenase (short-subunit alcohol dehydrogenase family)
VDRPRAGRRVPAVDVLPAAQEQARARGGGGLTARLDGRVVAIAGAAGGLGPTVAQALADAGASLALTDRDRDRLDEVARDLALSDDRVDSRVVDLLDENATREWANALTERFGRVDAVAHLVGGWRGGQPLGEASLDDWALLHDLLIRTVQHTSRAFLPALKASGHGRFVLVSAKAASAPTGDNAAYASAKAAAEAWTLALADELAGTGATANILVVNAILTPRMRAENPDKAYATFTSAEDIAHAIAWVVSDAGAKMNGQRLHLHP